MTSRSRGGSRAADVLRRQHDRMPEYGAGQGYSAAQWRILAEQFITDQTGSNRSARRRCPPESGAPDDRRVNTTPQPQLKRRAVVALKNFQYIAGTFCAMIARQQTVRICARSLAVSPARPGPPQYY
jgi:hypothetical protein